MLFLQVLLNVVCLITIGFVIFIFVVSAQERKIREEAELAEIDEFFKRIEEFRNDFR